MKFRKIFLACIAMTAMIAGMFAGCGSDKKTAETTGEKCKYDRRRTN
ncbi:MAG: hypothetical protein L6V93_02485 [Clostridiales bacterium]|nr:MAG: hypothetical protein L6V93_02485 [Clostridiales bacterium]